jgi:hypothetical protein
MMCIAFAACAPLALSACALDATDDSALAGAKHSELVVRGDDPGTSTNGASTKPTNPNPPPPQPEPSPWHYYAPNREPEPSPWNGAQQAGDTAAIKGAPAQKGFVTSESHIREVQLDTIRQ